jgi:hypothetical protein
LRANEFSPLKNSGKSTTPAADFSAAGVCFSRVGFSRENLETPVSAGVMGNKCSKHRANTSVCKEVFEHHIDWLAINSAQKSKQNTGNFFIP